MQARSMFLQHAEDYIDLPRFMQVLEHYNLTWCILYHYQVRVLSSRGLAMRVGVGQRGRGPCICVPSQLPLMHCDLTTV